MRRGSLVFGTAWLVWVLLGCLADIGSAKERHHVGVVSFGGGQREVVIGMEEVMQELGYEEGKNIAYTIVEEKSYERARTVAEDFLRERNDAVNSPSTPIKKQVGQVITDITVGFNIGGNPAGACTQRV